MAHSIHRRNLEYKNKVSRSTKHKLFGVAIDPAKTFHRVIIFDFTGKILIKPFSMNVLNKGYLDLKIKILKATRKRLTDNIYIAVESAGGYSENLLNNLNKDYKNVYVVHSTSVAKNRSQRSIFGLKTDDIDCGAIGDLLIRGEFNKFYPLCYENNYIKDLVYWREGKINSMVNLKNQIKSRFERIYPGLISGDEDDKKLFVSDKCLIYQGMLNLGLSSQELIKIPTRRLLELLGYRTYSYLKKIREVKLRLKGLLLPDENFVKHQISLISKDVKFLKVVESEIEGTNQLIMEYAKNTPIKYVVGQIKGVSLLYGGLYMGLIGDLNRYPSAGHIFSMAGLCPSIKESGGSKAKGLKITRAGNKLLRAYLFRMAAAVIVDDPYFNSYYHRLKAKNTSYWKQRVINVANKLNRIMFALMRDKTEFNRNGMASKNSRIAKFEEIEATGSSPGRLDEKSVGRDENS